EYDGPLNLGLNLEGIYVADVANNRIQKLDTFTHVPVWTCSSDLGLAGARGISVLQEPLEELMYIADTGNNRVLVAKIPKADPASVWITFKQKVAEHDMEAALAEFSPASVGTYREFLDAIGLNKFAQDISRTGDPIPLSINSDDAQYAFHSTIDGVEFTFVV